MNKKEITIGKDFVMFGGNISPYIAKIIFVTKNDKGQTQYYLDRLIHSSNDEFQGFHARGAISTIITKL